MQQKSLQTKHVHEQYIAVIHYKILGECWSQRRLKNGSAAHIHWHFLPACPAVRRTIFNKVSLSTLIKKNMSSPDLVLLEG